MKITIVRIYITMNSYKLISFVLRELIIAQHSYSRISLNIEIHNIELDLREIHMY